MKETAVVILNWNGLGFLEQFLQNVVENTVDETTKVCVIDNASDDKSVAFITTNFPEIELVCLDKNYGFAGGYNKGLKAIEATYLILLNSDVEVTPDWTKPLIKCLLEDENTAACMPKIKSFHNKNMFEYAGAAGGYIDKYGYPFCKGRLFDSIEEDKGQYDTKSQVFWASGAAFCVKKELFVSCNGFDNDFFAHMEEIDLCWRLKNQAYSIWYIPESTVYHVGGGTLPQANPKKTFLNFRNNLYLLYKNLPKEKLHKTLIIRRFLDLIAYCVFLIKFDFKNANAILKAYKEFRNNTQVLKQKREELLISSKEITHSEILQKSIVFEHFVLRKSKIIL